MHDSCYVAREICGISVCGKIAFPFRALETPAERRLACVSTRGQFFPNRIGGIATGQRTLDDETSTRSPWISQQVNRTAQKPLDHGASSWSAQSIIPKRGRALRVAIKRLAKKSLFVAERGVKAGAIDAHRLRQIRKRGALVTLAPEDVQSAVERKIDIERPRPADVRGPRLLFHTHR